MPPRVYRGRSAFEWHPANGGSIRLCSLDAKQSEVWQQYEQAVAEYEKQETTNGLIQRFFGSADFRELSRTTQSDYRKYANKIIPVFGKMLPSTIQPVHIRKYMDIRGEKSKVQANREKAFFSRVFRWAFERGLVEKNPCQGVRQFKEKQRDVYISDDEYEAVYEHACPVIRAAMEISYRCAARQGDVLALTKSELREEGIYIQQGKTGVKQIKEWSAELHKAVKECDEAFGNNSIFVIHQKSGSRFTRDGFNTRWRKARALAREATGLALNFTFHDLKAKGISDYEGSSKEKQAFSGHKTERQVATYDRRIKVVKTISKANASEKND
ncbi:tyrosine-type recombinase/integrase [Photobacterium galatheae]|nr:tyrosine-type recombinase/integrase [Photobacterium galatheae]